MRNTILSILVLSFLMPAAAQERVRWSKDYIYADQQLVATVSSPAGTPMPSRYYLPYVPHGYINMPAGIFSTTLAIQNASAATANCRYYLYASGGTQVLTSAPLSIGSRAGLFHNTASMSLAAGIYSARVDCDQAAEVVTLSSDADSAASYRGVPNPVPTWYAPGIFNNYYGFYSAVLIQNISGNAVDVVMNVYGPNSATPVAAQSLVLPPYGSGALSQAGLAGVTANVAHSAVIQAVRSGSTTPSPVAVTVNITSGVNPEMYSYTAFSSGARTWYTPSNMAHYHGWNSALIIQNVGSSSTTVTVNYSNGMSQSSVLAQNAAWHIYLPNQSPLSTIPPDVHVLVGATITSNSQPIVVMVNESNDKLRAATYMGLTGGSAAMYAPMVANRSPLVGWQSANLNSSVTCQNLGTVSTNMTLQYVNTGVVLTQTNIAPGGIWLWYTPNNGVGAPYMGSAWVSSSNGQPIGCIINVSNDGIAESLDNLVAYETGGH